MELQKTAEILRSCRTFVLTTHINPDGDAIGSEVALAETLHGQGKQVEIINHSPTPAVYDFLDPERRIRVYVPARDRALIADAEVIVVLDTSQTDRVNSLEADLLASRAIKICIDHHLNSHPFADHYLIDEDATSTGEILYRLLTSLSGNDLSPAVASALYAAIVTDTGSFRYPRVDPEIHRMAAHLIECGADPVEIYSKVYERWSAGRTHLLGETLASIKTAADGRISYVSITRELLRETGTSEEDTDNFTSYLMSIAGVRAGILLLEISDGVKISFRSRGDIPINELAQEFGGNGHKNAAGARVAGIPLTTLEKNVVDAARKYV
jgi:phosphoesterase RecJ-like protein